MDYRWGVRGEYALVRFLRSYLEVDLEDMRSGNRILDVFGRDGTLQLHLPGAKFPSHYMVDSQTMAPCQK